MCDNVMCILLQAQDTLETDAGEPVSCDNVENLKEVIDDVDMYTGRNPRVKELKKIITDPHFKVKKCSIVGPSTFMSLFSSGMSHRHQIL